MTNGMQSQNPLPAAGSPAKKTKPIVWILGGCAVFLAICGIAVSAFLWWGYHKAKNYVNGVTGPGSMTNVAELWSDVPPMEGMTTSSHIEMPLALKVLARPILDGMMRGVNDGADPGHWDWTSYTVPGKTTADVEAFYTSERMGSHGWKPEGGCMNSPNSSNDQATFCAFQKQEGNQKTGVLVIAANDKEHNAVSIFFIRQEAQEKSPPTK